MLPLKIILFIINQKSIKIRKWAKWKYSHCDDQNIKLNFSLITPVLLKCLVSVLDKISPFQTSVEMAKKDVKSEIYAQAVNWEVY